MIISSLYIIFKYWIVKLSFFKLLYPSNSNQSQHGTLTSLETKSFNPLNGIEHFFVPHCTVYIYSLNFHLSYILMWKWLHINLGYSAVFKVNWQIVRRMVNNKLQAYNGIIHSDNECLTFVILLLSLFKSTYLPAWIGVCTLWICWWQVNSVLFCRGWGILIYQ